MSLGKVGVIVAARTGSTRLPGKALLPLRGIPMVAFLLRRLRPSRRATILFATTNLAADDILAHTAGEEGVPVFRGASDDVVARYVDAAKRFGLDTVVRVTGDCPFVNAELVDYCVERAGEWKTFDLATTKTRFPVGLDAEIYRAGGMAALHRSGKLTSDEREHLTLHYYNHSGRYDIRHIDPRTEWQLAGAHFTVDTSTDYAWASSLAATLPEGDVSLASVAEALARQRRSKAPSNGAREAAWTGRR
jgi:spore coat polysaccharide biosynthesis protein SpsF